MSSDNVLARIAARRAEDVAARKAEHPLMDLRARAADAPPPRGFAKALQAKVEAGLPALITEIKKASPSVGLIRADFDPAALAQSYEAGGAACLSVLTEPHWFQGADEHLIAAHSACTLPVLRKDFLVDSWQVWESRVLGADCVLLIMATLDDAQAAAMAALAQDLGMDVLMEVHDAAELQRACALPTALIGINNRNLKTLKVDLQTTIDLAPQVPADRALVCESGLKSGADLARARAAGAHRFLIGENLMRQNDVTAAVHSLIQDTLHAAAA